MNRNKSTKIWPYQPRTAIIAMVILLALLLTGVSTLRMTTGWPPDSYISTVLIGVLVLSLLPVLLTILDVIIDRGGSISYGDFKVDFTKVQQLGSSGFSVPVNIGVRGEPVQDSGTSTILETLREATACGIVVLDLEDGHAWWETRLLVLLAGAGRLGKPDKIVFVGTVEGKEHCFQGWCNPTDLLRCLLKDNPHYLRSFHNAYAAARQWELLKPLELVPPNTYYQTPPPKPIWMEDTVYQKYGWWAFSNTTGLPNELLTEQILQNDLGEKIESKEGSKHLSIVRLHELFQSVLIKHNIDLSWSLDQQKEAFLNSDNLWIAITNHGKYSGIVSRAAILNEVLRPMLDNSQIK